MRLTAKEISVRSQMGRRLRGMRGSESLRTVGRRAHLSYAYLSEVEHGKKSITLLALARWVRALGCSLREFAQHVSTLDAYKR